MFVSYRLEDGSYGYMCFTDNHIKIDKLHEYIESRVFRKPSIQFICQYSNKKEHWIQMHTDGIYRNELIKAPLKDVEDICDLYSYLHKKYGFTNILGFL